VGRGRLGAAREFTGEMLAKPGVGLIGHLNLIHPLLAQVMGRREVEYVQSLDASGQEQTAARIFGADTVCVVLCERLAVRRCSRTPRAARACRCSPRPSPAST
jgi:HPr kinase/phosphorylase